MRILIIKLGALGDVVRTAYMLPGLHRKFGPSVEITWVTRPGAHALLRCNPHVARVSIFGTTDATIPAAEQWDWILSLDDEFEAAAFATQIKSERLSGAFVRGGAVYYTEDVTLWFDMGLISRKGKAEADALKRANTLTHDAIFARMFGLEIARPSFYNAAEAAARGRTALGNGPRKKIGLNLSASRRWPSKAMLLDEAIKLTRRLQEANLDCIAIGGKDDQEYLAALAARAHIPIVNNLSLLEFAGFIHGLDGIITSDSLALHLAIAQGVPNVSFYAPTSAAEINTFGSGRKVISQAVDYCSYKADADNRSITAERVSAAARELFTETESARIMR
jgi:heptosyltransferase-2